MINPGIYPSLSNLEYHTDSAISRSGVMKYLESPYKYWAEYLNPDRPAKHSTQAMEFGSAFHTFILEPQLFNELYTIELAPILLKDVGREAYDTYKKLKEDQLNSGKIILTFKDYLLIRDMHIALKSHKEAWELIQGAVYEQSYFWEDEHTGIMCKARPDILHDNMIVDLKTCASADSHSFQNTMYLSGYHIQGAMIREGIKQLTGKNIPNVINICIEKKYPYSIGIKIISEAALEAGHMKFKQTILDIKNSKAYNQWSDYETEIVELPKWAT